MDILQGFWTLYFTAYETALRAPLEDLEFPFGLDEFTDSIRYDMSHFEWDKVHNVLFADAWAGVELRLYTEKDFPCPTECSDENNKLYAKASEQSVPHVRDVKTIVEARKAGKWMVNFYQNNYGFELFLGSLKDADAILPVDIWEKWAQRVMSVPDSWDLWNREIYMGFREEAEETERLESPQA